MPSVGKIERRGSICPMCRVVKPYTHFYGEQGYCSAGCKAKAQWSMNVIPLPRSAS